MVYKIYLKINILKINTIFYNSKKEIMCHWQKSSCGVVLHCHAFIFFESLFVSNAVMFQKIKYCSKILHFLFFKYFILLHLMVLVGFLQKLTAQKFLLSNLYFPTSCTS